jgi:hypothetical protein
VTSVLFQVTLLLYHSFAYLEFCLSLSQTLKYFHLTLPHSDFGEKMSQEAILPLRLEWVGAVPLVGLEVEFHAR